MWLHKPIVCEFHLQIWPGVYFVVHAYEEPDGTNTIEVGFLRNR